MADQEKAYRAASDTILTEIESFYAQYAVGGELSNDIIYRNLTGGAIDDARIALQEYIVKAKKNNLDLSYQEELREMYARAQMSRMKALQNNINFEIENLYAGQQKSFRLGLGDNFEETFYRTIYNIQRGIGFGDTFNTLNKATINRAIKQEWLGDNYSSRIWQNKDRLILSLEQTIPQGFILGHNPRKVAEDILRINFAADKTTSIKTAYYRSERLARTEYNHIANQASIKGYLEAGLSQYMLLNTLDLRTSEICEALDTTTPYDISKIEVGVNYPPFHPNCRTTTIPYFKPDEIDKITASGTKIPFDMSYNEWYGEYVE